MRHGPGLRASVLDYAEPGSSCAVTSGHGHGDREGGESRAAAQTVHSVFAGVPGGKR